MLDCLKMLCFFFLLYSVLFLVFLQLLILALESGKTRVVVVGDVSLEWCLPPSPLNPRHPKPTLITPLTHTDSPPFVSCCRPVFVCGSRFVAVSWSTFNSFSHPSNKIIIRVKFFFMHLLNRRNVAGNNVSSVWVVFHKPPRASFNISPLVLSVTSRDHSSVICPHFNPCYLLFSNERRPSRTHHGQSWLAEMETCSWQKSERGHTRTHDAHCLRLGKGHEDDVSLQWPI